jgi:hypothetical protein
VFLRGKSKGRFEPVKTGMTAVLNTDKGDIGVVRVISDGDCAGALFPATILEARTKPKTVCVGFEVPEGATPEAITISVATKNKGGEQATWKLPAAS